MTDLSQNALGPISSKRQQEVLTRLKKRHAAETRFKAYGILAISMAMFFLAALLWSIVGKGYTAVHQTQIKLEVMLDADKLSGDNISKIGQYPALIKAALRAKFPDVTDRRQKKKLYGLISNGADITLRDYAVENPDQIGKIVDVWLPASDDIDMLHKGSIDRSLPEDDRRIKDLELGWYDQFMAEERIEKTFNSTLFSNGNSREPELAGLKGAIVGSAMTMLITLVLAFPIGVAASIYLEAFAPKNKFTDLIEVNINNLAAVPSIVFGLLGLAIFLGVMNMDRSSPLVGGMVLALMTLPTIIIASRAAIKSVPPSIREAALGLGASRVQAVFHHVLPLAMPGILTGTIIGMAQALGETAPLLMVGMSAFIVDSPQTITDAATVLPAQIYQWADQPERAFVERTSAAIMVLLAFLITMNGLAIILRKRFERTW